MRGRSLQLLVLTSFVGLAGTRVKADPVYALADLGAVDSQTNPDFNYLNALSSTDKGAFQAGSFERFSHPVSRDIPTSWVQGDIERWSWGLGATRDTVSFVSGNNRGDAVGTTSHKLPQFNIPAYGLVAVYRADPHTVHPVEGSYGPEGIQSPGYLEAALMSGNPNAFYGTVTGINDHQLITGSQQKTGNQWQEYSPVLITAEANIAHFINLGSLGGKNGAASALNNEGQAVGWSEIADGTRHAFLYDQGIMEDLNALIPPTSGINLEEAVGIDALGRIVAFGTDASGATHEYLLTPSTVPEPSALSLFGLLTGGLMLRRLRRREMAIAAD